MPRRNRVRRVDTPLRGGAAPQRVETGHDGDWIVRQVSGLQAIKFYRCPGCEQEIRPGDAHIVAWPAEGFGSVEDRRHWHRGCWEARGRRRPTSRRW